MSARLFAGIPSIPRFRLVLVLVVCTRALPLLALAPDERTAEAEEASMEDARAGRKLGDACISETALRGHLHPVPEAENEDFEVLGIFAVRGRAYRLKAGDEALRRELLKRVGQEVWLEGEVRNRGKYFIARRFATALPPAVALRDRKGL